MRHDRLTRSAAHRFVANYVENLNTKDLSFGVFSGDVRLKNLKLKKEALDKFRLPVDVKEGYLGDLTLTIPWTNVRTARATKLTADMH